MIETFALDEDGNDIVPCVCCHDPDCDFDCDGPYSSDDVEDEDEE